jgi:hypothetical protein
LTNGDKQARRSGQKSCAGNSVETGDVGEFERMSKEELRAHVYGEKLPPKGETKH